VPVIDLHAMTKPFYEALGPVQAHIAFAGKDTTHHSNYGSYEIAKCVVEAIRQQRLPLAKYLVDMPRFDPAHPDSPEKFDIPAEPLGTVQNLMGIRRMLLFGVGVLACAVFASAQDSIPTLYVIGEFDRE